MNWLTNFVRPKIKSLVGAREVPENLWIKCPSCEQMVFHKELEKNLQVCPHCSHHMRLDVKRRLEMLFDDGVYKRIELPKVVEDPLKFRDLKTYAARIKDSRVKTAETDGIIVASGTMGGINVVIAAFNFEFMGGSMGMAVGEGLVAAAELALLQEAPLIAIPASGGARMQEGILSLMQMARTTVAVDRVKERGLPYIVVMTDPTTGGVTASFAMIGDIHIAEPGAVIGFAGARVIEATIREKLPEGFQRSEYLRDHGMVDMVVPRHDLKKKLVSVLDLLRNRGPVGQVVQLRTASALIEAEERSRKPEKKAKAPAALTAAVVPPEGPASA